MLPEMTEEQQRQIDKLEADYPELRDRHMAERVVELAQKQAEKPEDIFDAEFIWKVYIAEKARIYLEKRRPRRSWWQRLWGRN